MSLKIFNTNINYIRIKVTTAIEVVGFLPIVFEGIFLDGKLLSVGPVKHHETLFNDFTEVERKRIISAARMEFSKMKFSII
jgi:hypothetical protein